MPNKRKHRFSLKRNNVKVFLFFLLFTSCLWLFTQFSKNYTKEVEVALSYTNIPENRIINQESDQKLKLVLNGNGFRLMSHTWRKPLLKVDVTDAVVNSDKEYQFYIDKNDKSLLRKLNFRGKILKVKKDTLKLKLDVNLEKKLPLDITGQIKYAAGYGSDKGLVTIPDSIMVSGPEFTVDTLQSIKTIPIALEGLNTDYKSILEVDTIQLPDRVKVFPFRVEAQIQVSKFTEGSKKIPITVQNVPEDTKITIFPKEVTVVYRIGLEKLNKISAIDFKIIADYKKASEESSYLILELDGYPDFVHDVRLQDKQVQYVILK